MAMGNIPYGRQVIDKEDIATVVRVLESDFLTCGPEVEKFEQAFAEKMGAKYAIAVSNGTAALHLAMIVAGVTNGDRVLTSPNTFLASANAAIYVGATPDFADIDPTTGNLTAASLEAAWQPDVRAVVPVAYAGQAPDMADIYQLAKSRGVVVIEDACHGTGGGFLHDGTAHKLGGHPFADISIFSFHPVKTMTTAEGGMLTTDNEEMANRIRLLRNHGMVRESGQFQGSLPDYGPWTYEMQDLGYNYRMTDIQAALGQSQLHKLHSFIRRRREIVAEYNQAFQDLPFLQVPSVRNPADRDHISWHLYSPQWDFPLLGKSRTEVMQELRQHGIGTQVLYIPVYLQPYYQQRFGYSPGKCPNAETLYSKTLSIPLHPSMDDTQVQHVIHSIRSL